MAPRSRIIVGASVIAAAVLVAMIVRARRFYATQDVAPVLESTVHPSMTANSKVDLAVWRPADKDELARVLRERARELPQQFVSPEKKDLLVNAAIQAFLAYQDPSPDSYLKLKSDSGQKPSRKLGSDDLAKSWSELRSSIADGRWDVAHASLVAAPPPSYHPRRPTQPGTSIFHSIVTEATPERLLPDGVDPQVVEFDIAGELHSSDGSPVPGRLVIAMAWSPERKMWILVGTSLVDVPTGKPMRVPPA